MCSGLKKISDFLTVKKCCCGVPLKEGIYINAFFLLIYCAFTEIRSCKAIYWLILNFGVAVNITEPLLSIGGGLSMVDYNFRYNAYQDDVDFLNNMMLGILIAWSIVTGLLVISTAIMVLGIVKGNTFLLLQFLVISAVVCIGNIADIVLSIVCLSSRLSRLGFRLNKHLINDLVLVAVQSFMLVYAFLLVRSYFYRVTRPQMPVRFKTLEGHESEG